GIARLKSPVLACGDVLRLVADSVGIALAVSLWAAPVAGATRTAAPASSVPDRAVIDKYCVSCHSDRARTGGLSLEQLDTRDVSTNAEIWEKVVRKLRAGAMPPPGVRHPDAQAAGAFVSSLESALDAAAARKPDPGRPPVHRLNRSEYAN